MKFKKGIIVLSILFFMFDISALSQKTTICYRYVYYIYNGNKTYIQGLSKKFITFNGNICYVTDEQGNFDRSGFFYIYHYHGIMNGLYAYRLYQHLDMESLGESCNPTPNYFFFSSNYNKCYEWTEGNKDFDSCWERYRMVVPTTR